MKQKAHLKNPPLDLLQKGFSEEENGKINDYFFQYSFQKEFFLSLSERQKEVFCKTILIEQAHIFGGYISFLPLEELLFQNLLDTLCKIDDFYEPIGGLIGYQKAVLQYIKTKNHSDETLFPIDRIDLQQDKEELFLRGLLKQNEVAEVYVLGGASERLALKDPITDEDLPASVLPFLGMTLIEGLIQDLQAREYLHYIRFGHAIQVPLVLMTSSKKNTNRKIQTLFEEKKWFYRDPCSIHILNQPLVPCFDETGKWIVSSPLSLSLNPSGHGAIWQMLEQSNLFEKMEQLGIKALLVRQLNNPMANFEGLMSRFIGKMEQLNAPFGLVGTDRKKGASEGALVRRSPTQVTNLEYFQFEGKEEAIPEGALSNINLLYGKIASIQKAISLNRYPGLVVNFKNNQVGRLESTMQNIVDQIEGAVVVYEKREKAASPIKRQEHDGMYSEETPRFAFNQVQKGRAALLQEAGFLLPWMGKDPIVFFYLHPVLILDQKRIQEQFQGGKMAPLSILTLQCADVLLKNITIEGGLEVFAQNMLGHIEEDKLIYSDRIGSLRLENVIIQNQGLDYLNSDLIAGFNNYKESCKIYLKGRSLFVARDVTLSGNISIIVEDGTMCEAKNQNGKLIFERSLLP